MKRFLSLLLALALFLSAPPMTVLATEKTIQILDSQDGTTQFVESAEELEIVELPQEEFKQAITEDIYERYYFENFDDLKELAGRTWTATAMLIITAPPRVPSLPLRELPTWRR